MSDIAPLAHPDWLLPLGGVVAACALGLVWAYLRGERALRRLIGVAPGRSDRLLRDALLLVALAALAIALVGPRFGTRELRIPATGLDLVMLIDVSRSMDATDVPPSRMARARRVAADVLQRLGEGDRVALAVFAGHGALVTPLTSDKSALSEMLPALDPTLLSDASSDGAAGLRAALPAFAASGLRPRLVLVLSDGEVGRLRKRLLSEVDETNARVVAVLLGTEPGAPIPDRGRQLLDSEGKVVHTRRVVADLAPLVEASGGRIFLADGWGEVDLPSLVAEIRRDAIPTAEGTLLRRVPVTWVAPPAALVLLLLLVEAWPGAFRLRRASSPASRPRFSGQRWAAPARVLPWLVLCSLVPQAAEPQTAERPPDPRLALEAQLRADGRSGPVLVALGIARARAGEAREAEHAFRAAALVESDPRTAALAWYDLGVLALEGGRLEDARNAFFDSLALDFRSHKAKFNLEWTLAALRRSESEPPPNGPPEPDPESEEEDSREEPHAEESTDEQQSADAAQAQPNEAQQEGPSNTPSRMDSPRPAMDQAEAERWLDEQEDDVRAALDAQLGELGGPWLGGSRW